MTQILPLTKPFIPLDKTTWPPLKTPIIWVYNKGDKREYIIASLSKDIRADGSVYLNFEEAGIGGYEWESDLDSYTPFAWLYIPAFDLPYRSF